MICKAVADAVSLLANIVMVSKALPDPGGPRSWAQRRGGAISPEFIGRIAPTHTEGTYHLRLLRKALTGIL
jgi:hypothetical protein